MAQILSFLSPPVIVGIMAIAVTVVLFVLQRRKKSLSYEILSSTPLLKPQEELKGRLQILFDSKPVADVYLLLIRISNTGNMPIMADDFERPLSVELGPEARILTLDVSEKRPESLKPVARPKEGGIIMVEPLLLNGGDSFILKVIVSQYDSEKFEIDGRIAGVREIREPPEKYLQGIAMVVVGAALLLGGQLVASSLLESLAYIAMGEILILVGFWIGLLKRTLRDFSLLRERELNK